MDFADKKIGFIGGGAMAEALVKSFIKSVPKNNIFVSDHKDERCKELSKKYGVNASVRANDFLGEVDVVIFAIKPKDAVSAMQSAVDMVNDGTLIISIVAGLTLAKIEEIFSENPVVRIMPNVCQSVGEGMAAYSLGKNAKKNAGELTENLWSMGGKIVCVKENLMDAVTGLSGSAPAFVFLMLDALADGGVAAGLTRKDARLMAAQTMLGAAKMALETEKHPGELRDQVTSPAGTTITGVRVLEKAGFRSAVIEAVVAAAEKSKELGK